MIELPYQYIWQNPLLRPVMYLVCEQKLREFLLLYDEAGLVAQHLKQRATAFVVSPSNKHRPATITHANLTQRSKGTRYAHPKDRLT